ncbi:MAG: hypothetical protein KY467_01200 [Gemmatimonadetes bacterium]|nr:hypothetical protein [Gemmatimonadota bacterium]
MAELSDALLTRCATALLEGRPVRRVRAFLVEQGVPPHEIEAALALLRRDARKHHMQMARGDIIFGTIVFSAGAAVSLWLSNLSADTYTVMMTGLLVVGAGCTARGLWRLVLAVTQ